MANITAAQVKELRERTGLPMMECKKALVSSEGNMDEAIKILREKGMLKGKGKESRVAADGLVAILKKNGVTVMAEVNSETDFVAKNDSFKVFVDGVLNTICDKKPATVEALFAEKYADSELTVEEKQNEMRFTIGEKISIRRFVIIDGITSTYIHGKGSTGVIVNFEADENVKNNPAFAEVAKNVALQVAAMPVLYLNKESVPEKDLEEEKSIILAQLNNDPKNANKPDAILEKIAEGKMRKFFEENTLLNQAVVGEKESIRELLARADKEATVVAYKRFALEA